MYDKNTSEEIEFFDTNLWIGQDYLSAQKNKDLSELEGLLIERQKKNKIKATLVSNLESLYYYPRYGNDRLSVVLKDSKARGSALFGCWLMEQEVLSSGNSFEKKLIERIAQGFYCLRLVPKSQKYPFEKELLEDIYEICGRYRYPVMISIDEVDITGNKNIEWDKIIKIAKAFKDMPMIVDGGSSKELMYNSYIFSILAKTENVYFNTHNLLAVNQIEDICERYGSSRLLFDAYYPFYIPEINTDRIILSDLDIEDKKAISYNNFDNLLKRIRS